MDISYVGGIVEAPHSEHVKNQKMSRFLDTKEIIETKTLMIDVENMFERKFMCCKSNCDFYVKEKKGKGLLKTVKVDWVDRSCCEGGSLEIPDELVKNIDKHISGIRNHMDAECIDFMDKRKLGWKDKRGSNTGIVPLKKDNRCIFTFVRDGMPWCALHSYALENDIPILDLKPFECFMFPVDLLKVDDKVLLTCISNSTFEFSRWGANHIYQECLHKSNDGIPMYQYAKDVIVEAIGLKEWKAIDKLYKEWLGR